MLARSFLILATLYASPAWAAAPPTIGVWGMFFHGLNYPEPDHAFQLQLEAGAARKAIQVTMPVFSRKLLDGSFEMQLNGPLEFTVDEAGDRLVTIRFTSEAGRVMAKHSCLELPELSGAFPFKQFPAYIAPGLLRLSCPSKVGMIDLQFNCKSDDRCW